MKTSHLLRLVIAVGLLLLPTSWASANNDPSKTAQGNKLDPNYIWSPEELARIAQKESEIKERAKVQSLTPAYNQATLYVGSAETYREPNDFAHRNYCGPSSTQVALRAGTSLVPSLETIATAEYLDPDWGVYIDDITPVVNYYLGTTFYTTDVASGQSELGNWIEYDIDEGFATVTGTYTTGMPGWVVSANHIVTVYGYNYSTPTSPTIYYVDTGSEYAGHLYGSGGKYFNTSIALSRFWGWVSSNNAQVW